MARSERVRLAFVAGLVAGAAAGLVFVLARVFFAILTPPELVLDRFTSIIPSALFSAAIDTLKFAAKPLLFAGLVGGALLLSGGIGALYGRLTAETPRAEQRQRKTAAYTFGLLLTLVSWFGLLPLGGSGLLGGALAGGSATAALSYLLGGLVYGAVLWQVDEWLLAPADVSGRPVSPARRYALQTLGWGAVVGSVGYFALRGASALAAGQPPARKPAGPEATLLPEITPTKDFYTVSKNISDPVVDVAKWRLEITGLVAQPLSLSYDDLLALPSVEQYATLECISNEVGGDLMSNALWKGVRLKDLLEKAAPTAGVRKVQLHAADSYDDSITLERALNPANIVAYQMNQEPLTTTHGAPARLIVPGIYGMKNVKWLTSINLVDYDFKGYWQQRGWSDEAPYKTTSRIDIPPRSTDEPAGPVKVGGVAFSGDRGIGRVEVSFDKGSSWRPATLKPALSPYTWVLWTLDWLAPAGQQTLIVRAADGEGQLQTDAQADPVPDGSSGLDSLVVRIFEP